MSTNCAAHKLTVLSVNAVFNPDFIDCIFPRAPKHRLLLLADTRTTNYGVVRLELIEEIYERMYDQQRELGPNERVWPHRILGGRQINIIEPLGAGGPINLQIQSREMVRLEDSVIHDVETFHADLVIAATGYQRTAHVDMLEGAWDLLPQAEPGSTAYHKGIVGWNVVTEQGERKLTVGRNYQVQFMPGAVADGSGVWLQGCCEETHGVSSSPFILFIVFFFSFSSGSLLHRYLTNNTH